MTKKKDVLKINEKNLFKHIDKNNLIKDVSTAIKIVSYQPDNFHIYGSYNLAAQPFPSDIDGFEKILLCKNCSYDEAINEGENIIKKLVKKISQTKNVYIGDIKFCKDKEIADIFLNTDNKILENYYSLKNLFKKIYDKKYIDKDKLNKFNLLLEKSVIENKRLKKEKTYTRPSGKTYKFTDKEINDKNDEVLNQFKTYEFNDYNKYYQEIYEEIRNIILLRWTPEEIFKGFKFINGRKITLNTALKNCKFNYIDKDGEQTTDYSFIKIDLWVYINHKFIEVTNLIILYHFPKGKHVPNYLSFNDETTKGEKKETTFKESLKREIAKYYFSDLDKNYKPIKYAKRIFALANLYKDKKTTIKLIKLWRSPLNLLSSIKSELSTLVDIIEKIKKPPLKDIKKQIDEIKLKLDRIIDYDLSPVIYDFIKQILKSQSKKEIIDLIEKIQDKIKDLIDPNIVKYLKSVKLWPAPKKYLNSKFFTGFIDI